MSDDHRLVREYASGCSRFLPQACQWSSGARWKKCSGRGRRRFHACSCDNQARLFQAQDSDPGGSTVSENAPGPRLQVMNGRQRTNRPWCDFWCRLSSWTEFLKNFSRWWQAQRLTLRLGLASKMNSMRHASRAREDDATCALVAKLAEPL